MLFWISARELRRLERELARANKRADEAEDRLATERASKDWLTVQLASRLATKAGVYGLDHESLPAIQAGHPKGFIREEEPTDTARLQYYIKCYQDAGKPHDEAEQLATQLWEAEMRGENVTYEYEQEQ